MKNSLRRTSTAMATFLVALLFTALAAVPAPAQEKKVGQTNGVDNSKMGAYRALAQHIYSDFQHPAHFRRRAFENQQATFR